MIDILLIEDNPADVLLFEEYIDGAELRGSAITAVGSLGEAAQRTQDQSYDVVVLDLSLPDYQREATVYQAKQLFADLPVVILSGTDDLALAKTSVKEGVQDYLVKDDLNEILLVRSINYAIERHRLLQEKARVERSLIERNHYLEIANRRLEQFAYTVSHDLRAPLARILGLSQVIRHQPLNNETSELLTLVEQSAYGLDGSVHDLMNLLVIQKDVSQTATLIDMNELLASISESLSSQIEVSEAVIMSDFSALNQIVHLEPVLRSVLLNLLTNAIKYRSAQRPLAIRVALRPADYPWCCLSVSDNGLGIDLSKAGGQLFQLFARFHAHVEGKGIGLYMVKSLVEDCGGRIEAESQLNQGTTFRVYLRRYEFNAPPKRAVSTVALPSAEHHSSKRSTEQTTYSTAF